MNETLLFAGAGLTPTKLRTDRAFSGLSAKMEAYCQARFKGASPSEAYGQAYDISNYQPKTVSARASEMEADGRIVERIRGLVSRRDAQSCLAPTLTREFVINGVMNLALTATKEAVQLRAYELLGKSVGIDLFRETHVTEKRDRTVEEVDAALREHLASLAPMIEGTATPVPPVPPTPGKPDRRRKPTA